MLSDKGRMCDARRLDATACGVLRVHLGDAEQAILSSMLVIAHRGASRAAKENSVEAFQVAATMGADGVELDVRRSPDGRLFVHHDPLPTTFAGLEVTPGFAEILSACGEMLVNVEIKNFANNPGFDADAELVEPIIEEMRRHGAIDRWIISSFDWNTIQRCREVASDMMTAPLVRDATIAVIEQTAAAGHHAVHPRVASISADTVERCHTAGLAVNTWTCNDPDRLRELADIGVDAVFTAVPDVASATLGRRPGSPSPRWGIPG